MRFLCSAQFFSMLKSPMIKNSNIFKFTILAILTCLLSAQSWAFSVNSTKKHEVIVLHSGTESLAQRVSIIQNATKSIDIEYFIYRQDSSSQIITQELIKSAKWGVNYHQKEWDEEVKRAKARTEWVQQLKKSLPEE